MNGENGYPPGGYGPPGGGYGAPPPQQPGYAPSPSAPSPYGAQPPAYGAPPPAYGAPPPAYGAPPAYGSPPPYGQVQYPGQAMMGPGMGGVAPKNPGLAVAFELLGGTFFQTFGIGHLYAGNIGLGLGLMFGYWVLMAINIALMVVIVGFVTWPLTWIAFMIISAITANNAAKAANARAGFPATG